MAYRAELTKWWKAYTPVHGETIRSVSPYNQKIMGPLFKNAGHKVIHKVTDRLSEMSWGITFAVAMYGGAEWKHRQISMSHRS